MIEVNLLQFPEMNLNDFNELWLFLLGIAPKVSGSQSVLQKFFFSAGKRIKKYFLGWISERQDNAAAAGVVQGLGLAAVTGILSVIGKSNVWFLY